MVSSRRALLLFVLLTIAACHSDFQVAQYPTNDKLYQAAMKEFAAGRWDNAVLAFEKLTTDLSARDTLLPRAHWYLGRSHYEEGDFLLAASSFSRLVESFPDDSLADDAALAAARSYAKMWRKPQLDPTYGETALNTYNSLLSLYPTSPLIPEGEKELAALQEMFAQKEYSTGMYYFRRKGYDPAMIYFNGVVTKWPTTPTARLAQLRLVDSYKAIKYKPETAETCANLKKSYPGDADVALACGDIAPPADTTGVRPPTTGPPSVGKPATPSGL